MATTKPKLLVLELWGVGDLAIATPFLQAACEKFAVTLVAKPYARDLADRFWPDIKVVPFVAPWTAFRRKYNLLRWPWHELFGLLRLRNDHYPVSVSARWDPRDHFLMFMLGASTRIGFPRLGSRLLLTRALTSPGPTAHRYEYWRGVGRTLELELPPRNQLGHRLVCAADLVIIHSGAGQPVRVWPLERYRALVALLRSLKYQVLVACDGAQQSWWLDAGEGDVVVPGNVSAMINLLQGAAVFIGNDSGPGHLAAMLGVPTFTLFGPQLSEWFAPLHPAAKWLDGGACPYKPCSDYCRFSSPKCLLELDESFVLAEAAQFVAKHIGTSTDHLRTSSLPPLRPQ